jgi:hypothetical protein
MAIKASVQETIYSDIIESMQTGNVPYVIPKGPYYLLQGSIVPFTPQPTVLRIETDRVGEPIRIEVIQTQPIGAGVDPRQNRSVYTVVPASEVVTVGVQLGRGINRITMSVISREEERALLLVNATTIVAIFEAFARVLFTDAIRIIDEQQRAVSSRLATRLLEPFISFQDLLPDIQSLKILATRFASKGLIHSVGTELGVTELIKALTLTTPVYRPMDKDTSDLFPSLDPWTNNASQFAGQEAHVWLPNVGITSWLAFLGYISNQPDLFEILSVGEGEVVVRFQGELQRHRFDFDAFGTDFLTSQASTECFKSIIITVTMDVFLTIRMCAATYTFDLFIGVTNLLGDCRRTFDSGVVLDSDCVLDGDPVDPFTDGWEGLSLTGRFEQDSPFTHTLDTFVVASSAYTGSVCGYEGFYTQMVENQRYDMDLFVTITVSGFIQAAIGWFLESPDGTKWSITVNSTTQTLIATSGATGVLNNFKVTKPDTSEAAFDITNLGEVIVVSPPPGGEILFDTIYIIADDATVWHVTVNNLNVIETTKIFPV